jgi:hypothetical protein
MKYYISILISGLILIFSSCNKEEFQIDYQTIQLPDLGVYNAINYIDSGWILSGGNKGEKGFVLTTNLDFNEIDMLSDSVQDPVYDQVYCIDRFLFSSDRAAIYYKKNSFSGLRKYSPKEENWINTLNKKPLWQIEKTPNMGLYMAGGGGYEKGVILFSSDEGKNWIPYVLNNEMRSVSFQPPNTIWACGYGLLIKTNDFISGWEIVPFKNEFFTSIDFVDNNVGLISSFNGKIYQTTDGGGNWNEVFKIKGITGGTSINKISFINTNLAVAIGNNGHIAISYNGGKSWKTVSNFNETDLYDMIYINGWLYLVGNAPEVYKLLL